VKTSACVIRHRSMPLLAIGLACVVAACATEPAYRPVGHLAAGPALHNTAHVSLNGSEVQNVVELNDIDGWLIQVHPCADQPPVSLSTDWAFVGPSFCQVSPPDTLYGVVRVDWNET
jgi:hypothetical protein